MVAGDTTVQQILEAVAEEIEKVDGVKAAFANDRRKLGETPAVVVSWFSELPTRIENGSTQLWIVNALVTLYGAPIKGNPVGPDIVEYQNLIHPIVDAVNKHPQRFPWGSKMAALDGVHRVEVVGVRPARFTLEYAGHKYYGAEMYLEIKLHRRIEY